MVSFCDKLLTMDTLCHTKFANHKKLKWTPRTGLDGISEDVNLPYGRILQRESDPNLVVIVFEVKYLENGTG